MVLSLEAEAPPLVAKRILNTWRERLVVLSPGTQAAGIISRSPCLSDLSGPCSIAG